MPNLTSLYRTLRFIVRHPVNRRQPHRGLIAFGKWQLGKRLGLYPNGVTIDYVNRSRLHVDARFEDTVGAMYTGLTEFWEMGFALHLLRAEDLFVDCGANIGSYSIAVAAATNAKVIAMEPVPATFAGLSNNVAINQMSDRVSCRNVAVGATRGTLRMTNSLDSRNHVAEDGTLAVECFPLDELLSDTCPTLIKIDVEGFEMDIVQGAQNTLADPRLLALIIELNGSGSRYGRDESILHAQILAFGFHPFEYSAITRTLTSLDGRRSSLGNTIYIRNESAVRERIRNAPTFHIRGATF